MADARQRAAVVAFYDTHPINEDEILAKLRARGDTLDALTQATLKDFDQDHYGGTDAVDALARAAGIAATHRVLDVCSGMGGPARWLAHRIGCHVTGLDLTASRVEGARRLTQRVGLATHVDFVQGDATAMPFDDACFDVIVAQEAWCHIPDKAALLGECARVLRHGGHMAFTDIVRLRDPDAATQARLTEGMQMPHLASDAEYRTLLADAACTIQTCDDLSSAWVGILRERLRMYRSLRDTTIARFGEARFREYDTAYAHFVSLFEDGVLGGRRIFAVNHR